jgi:CRP-like cAMP-binding protein
MHLASSDCQNCSLNQRCVWKDSGEIPSVDLVPRVYRDDQSVFRAGDRCEGLYVVRSGLVRTSWIGADGVEQIIGFH